LNKVLAIGAHPDDIELGCGGTLVHHVLAGDLVVMLVMTDGENGPGNVVERRREQRESCDLLGVDRLEWGSLPDLALSNHEREIIEVTERVMFTHDIDLVYTHSFSDTHQDHRAVSLGTLGAARKCKRVLFYGSPSSFSFAPTIYTDISDTLEKKLAALHCHASQVAASEKVSPEHVRGDALSRGRQALVQAAEGFVAHRYVTSI
jgi:LmbE family N-acetylglucosaminyl deacetylase